MIHRLSSVSEGMHFLKNYMTRLCCFALQLNSVNSMVFALIESM